MHCTSYVATQPTTTPQCKPATPSPCLRVHRYCPRSQAASVPSPQLPPPRGTPLTLTTIAVAPVHFALGIPVEAPRSARAVRAPAEVVRLPSQLSPASRGRPLQEGRHLRPVQTRDAEVGGVAPQLSCPAAAWEPWGRVPGGEDLRALGSRYPWREREARDPRWPPRAGKVARVWGTRRGRLRAVQGRGRGGISAGHRGQCP